MPREAAISLSVVVVTYDSGPAVRRSLPALWAQLDPGDELIVFDNASQDGTAALVRSLVPDARVVAHDRNLGFAAGANAAARLASGDVLLFLNPDVEPAPGFIAAIRAPGTDWSAWQGLVTAGRAVNSGGGVLHFTGIAWAGQTAPHEPREVAFLSGACLAVPRREWERLGGFAADYFMYHEDVELSLRLRLRGGRIGIVPDAVVDHAYDFAKGPDKWRRLERNRWATVLRTYPGAVLAAVAPALLATELALLVAAAAGGWLPQKLAANAEALRALPRTLRERRAIQADRTVSAAAFAAWLTPDLDSEYLGRASRSALLRRGLRAYWRVAVLALRAGDAAHQRERRADE
jgi:N-acetylglucosaminyl-diphospho-decaprenol L-rhamnosyltransferase